MAPFAVLAMLRRDLERLAFDLPRLGGPLVMTECTRRAMAVPAHEVAARFDGLAASARRFVSLDDARHQRVAHHVGRGELREGHAGQRGVAARPSTAVNWFLRFASVGDTDSAFLLQHIAANRQDAEEGAVAESDEDADMAE